MGHVIHNLCSSTHNITLINMSFIRINECQGTKATSHKWAPHSSHTETHGPSAPSPHRDQGKGIHTHTHTWCISLWVLTLNVEIHTYINTRSIIAQDKLWLLWRVALEIAMMNLKQHTCSNKTYILHTVFCMTYTTMTTSIFSLTRYYFISNSRTIFPMD